MAICALALSGLWGCSSRSLQIDQRRELRVAGTESPVRIECSEADLPLMDELRSAVDFALARALRWGSLRRGLVLRIYPTHESLERAVGHHGFPWLRAWAQYRVVHVQSPRTWGIPWHEQLRELLAHELTHVVMYQAVGTERSWARKELPLWFREGMASTTAGQGYRRGTETSVAAELSADPRLDPLRPDRELLRRRKDLVYNSGHWAFEFLLRHPPVRGGDAYEGVRVLMRHIRDGRSFDEAFEQVWGMSQERFIRSWYRHLGVTPVSRRPGHSDPAWPLGAVALLPSR